VNEYDNPWTNWKTQDQWHIRGKSVDAVWTDEWAEILSASTETDRLKKVALDVLFTPSP
jgi:hypothetical protein